MTEHTPALNRTYGAYYNRIVPPEDAELTHVGPGTPCGEYLRRFWQPVCETQKLKNRPVPLRILCEDLVIFRDRSGTIGLLQRHCPHRGASLEFGIIEDHGLRCAYHGWHFGCDGDLTEAPTSGPGEKKPQLCAGAYPVREFHGLVFAYMGPPDKMPAFPLFDTLTLPEYELGLGQASGISNLKPCNWLQIMDNVMDLAHEAFLHARYSRHRFHNSEGREVVETSDLGELSFRRTPIGVVAQETRRVGDDVWLRSIEYICPNVAQIPQVPILPPRYADDTFKQRTVPRVTRWRVPVDNENTLEFALVRRPAGTENTYATKPSGVLKANAGGRTYEEMQSDPGDYEVQVSQRPIARHALEHLASTDRGVTMMRRMVREGVRAVAEGKDPTGVRIGPDEPIPTYCCEMVVRMAPAADPEADSALLKQLTRDIMDEALSNPPSKSSVPSAI